MHNYEDSLHRTVRTKRGGYYNPIRKGESESRAEKREATRGTKSQSFTHHHGDVVPISREDGSLAVEEELLRLPEGRRVLRVRVHRPHDARQRGGRGRRRLELGDLKRETRRNANDFFSKF